MAVLLDSNIAVDTRGLSWWSDKLLWFRFRQPPVSHRAGWLPVGPLWVGSAAVGSLETDLRQDYLSVPVLDIRLASLATGKLRRSRIPGNGHSCVCSCRLRGGDDDSFVEIVGVIDVGDVR